MKLKHKIYIVDDEQFNLELLRFVLCDDYEVMCFLDGKEFIDFFTHSPADLIILDINMPTLDGFEVFALLNKIAKPCPPVIFVSGSKDKQELEASMKVSELTFLKKPVNNHQLLEAVAGLLA